MMAGATPKLTKSARRIELGAEARLGLEQPRDAPIDAVEKRREDERGNGQVPAMLDGHADRGQPGAQPEQSEDVGDQHPRRHLAARRTPAPAACGRLFQDRREETWTKPLRRPQGPLARTLAGSSAKDRLAADRRLAGRHQNIAAGRQINIDPAAETDQPDTLA